MANANRPRGLVPVGRQGGYHYTGGTTYYYVPAADGTAIFVGDIVKSNGDSGAAGLYISGVPCEGMLQVVKATGTLSTGQDIVGVVTGFLPDPTALHTKYRAASTNRIVIVEDRPDVIYECQEDADTTPIAAASIGLNCAYVAGTGNTATGVSTGELDSSSVNTTATLPIRILGLVQRPDNALNTGGAGTDKAKFLVMLNTHLFAPNTAGV